MRKTNNVLKQKLKRGETVLGTFSSIPSSTLLESIGSSGVDFVVIDTEHGPVSIEKAEDLVRALEVSGAESILRVSANESHLILRALDIGTSGVQVPHVSTKEDAERVVAFSKYHPLGERGYTPFTRAGKYGLNAEGHAEDQNDETLVIVNVEGKEGVSNLEEIAEVKGLDVLFLGPYDLSQSVGRPGQVEDAEVLDSIKKCVKIAKDKGLACGSYARDLKYLETLIDCGVQYLTYGVDSWMILKTYKDLYDTYKKKIG